MSTATKQAGSLVERASTFDAIAGQYAASRPGYPDEVFATIGQLTRGRRLLEVGAGTGKATTGFVAHGFDVTAVEPGPAMIAQARALPALSRFRFVQSRFESWPRGRAGFDVIASAQAWRWVDPAVGYSHAADLLTRGGALCIFGSFSPFPLGPLKDAVDEAYNRHAPRIEAERRDTLNAYYTAGSVVPDQIGTSRRFGPVQQAAFRWTQTWRTKAYLALISTFSDHQLLGPERLSALLEDIGSAIDAHGGIVELPTETRLFAAFRL